MKPTLTSSRPFKAHENLIRLAILRQAGTLDKAILEGIMNSVDAGATAIHVFLSETKVVIVDDGRGFQSLEELESCFETFGNPHTMDSEGCSTDARFGAFRIGRGQLFAFGHNTWRTGRFQMVVDLPSANDLSYQLTRLEEDQTGCRITIQLKNLHDSVNYAQRYLERACHYLEVPVYFNGTLISGHCVLEEFPITNELFMARVDLSPRSSGILIYNQGILVESISRFTYGFGGVVVTKQQIPLNTARNEVMRGSAAWKKISAALNEECLRQAAGTKTPDDDGISAIVTRLIARELAVKTVRDVKFLKDVSGRPWSPNMIARLVSGHHFESQFEVAPVGRDLPAVIFLEEGSLVGDKLIQSRLALALDDQVLLCHGGKALDPGFFVSDILCLHQVKVAPADMAESLLKGRESYKLIPEKQWNARERLSLKALNSSAWRVQRASGVRLDTRHVVLGESDTADGWTDGKNFVAVSRAFIQKHDIRRPAGTGAMAALLLHEMAHCNATSGTHVHGAAFHHLFHDLVQHSLGPVLMSINASVVGSLSRLKKSGKLEELETPAAL